MSSATLSLVVLAAVLFAAAAASLLREMLPADHTSGESRDTIKHAIGLVATLSALVLGLLIASAKDSYDTKAKEIEESAAKVILLDHALRAYGDETKPIRDSIRSTLLSRIAMKWVEEESPADPRTFGEAASMPSGIDGIRGTLSILAPANDSQRALQSQSLQLLSDLAHTRWLLLTQKGSAIPVPFLVVLVFWLAVIFASLGLLAPRNGTIYAVIFVCALTVSSAIFLILELDRPFDGILKLSNAPLLSAISQLDR